MKKLFSIITLFTIACGILFAADKSKDPKDKLSLVGAHGNKYTFVFDITNESDKRVSFYVVRDPKDNIIGAEPELWYEISVPPKSSDIYTYSVKKGTEDTCHFQWMQEYHFVKSSGSAKIGYGDAKSKILIKENLDTWVDKEGWKEPFHMGVLSTFSAPDYKTWAKADEEYKKEHCRYVAYRTRNTDTDQIFYTGGYLIYNDVSKEDYFPNHKKWVEKEGLVITDSFEAATKKEAEKGIKELRDYEKLLLGQWEGVYHGEKAWFTLRTNHYYRIELENGVWEQNWWLADPEYINFQIYTSQEDVFTRYNIYPYGISFAGYGTWKPVTYYKVTEDYNKKNKTNPYSYRLKNAPKEAADYVNYQIGYKDGDMIVNRFSSSCIEKIEELLASGAFTFENDFIMLKSHPQK